MTRHRLADAPQAHDPHRQVWQLAAEITRRVILPGIAQQHGLDVAQHHQHHHNGVIRYASGRVWCIAHSDADGVGISHIDMLHPHRAADYHLYAAGAVGIQQLWRDIGRREHVHHIHPFRLRRIILFRLFGQQRQLPAKLFAISLQQRPLRHHDSIYDHFHGMSSAPQYSLRQYYMQFSTPRQEVAFAKACPGFPTRFR